MKTKEMIETLRYKANNIKAKIEPKFFNDCANALEELKEYEELEEQGLLLKLPCKIGDIVYSITRDFISEYKICSFEKYQEGFFFNWGCEKGIYNNIRGFTHFEIGRTVFLTKEAAEKVLMERND